MTFLKFVLLLSLILTANFCKAQMLDPRTRLIYALSEFDYKPLTKKKSKFKLTDKSDHYTFIEDSMPYAAFEIEDSVQYYLRVKSVLKGWFKTSVVDPIVLFADRDHNPIDAMTMNFVQMPGLTSDYLMANVHIPDEAKYLVIIPYVPSKDMGLEIVKEKGPGIMMVGDIPIATHIHGTSRSSYKRIKYGRLSVELKKYK